MEQQTDKEKKYFLDEPNNVLLVVRLLYVSDAIERHQTVEQRIEIYRKLLGPKYRKACGPAVTSRLCADLAFLLDRTGDVDGFSEWLAEAVAVDPSDSACIYMAAAIGARHLVASRICSRAPREAIQRPMISSVTPTLSSPPARG